MAAIAHGDAELEPETEPESVKWLRGLARRLNNILSVLFFSCFLAWKTMHKYLQFDLVDAKLKY